MPHARSAPLTGAVDRSRPARWVPIVALALLAPAAAWIVLPADTTARQAVLVSGETQVTGQSRVSGDQAARPQQSAVRGSTGAGTASAQTSGPAAAPWPVGQNVPVAVSDSAASLASQAPVDSAAGVDNLFLTIVGDQIFTSWGRAGDRPPPVDGMTAADRGGTTVSLDRGEDFSGSGFSDGPLLADTGGEVEDPLGEAPQACPRILPPGSNQATADALRSQHSCRYLSGCDVMTQQCTWFYQGRG